MGLNPAGVTQGRRTEPNSFEFCPFFMRKTEPVAGAEWALVNSPESRNEVDNCQSRFHFMSSCIAKDAQLHCKRASLGG